MLAPSGMSSRMNVLSKWLKRRFGICLRCHRCGCLCFRDTCLLCKAFIDAYYEAQLAISFPPVVRFEYVPMKWSKGHAHWLN